MNIQHISGRLKANNTDNVVERTHHNIWLAANKHSIYSLTNAPLWDYGIVMLTKQNMVHDGTEAAEEFIAKLAGFMKEEGIPELDLRGEITIVTTGEETVVHHIQIENNEVKYTKADIAWGTTKVA